MSSVSQWSLLLMDKDQIPNLSEQGEDSIWSLYFSSFLASKQLFSFFIPKLSTSSFIFHLSHLSSLFLLFFFSFSNRNKFPKLTYIDQCKVTEDFRDQQPRRNNNKKFLPLHQVREADDDDFEIRRKGRDERRRKLRERREEREDRKRNW